MKKYTINNIIAIMMVTILIGSGFNHVTIFAQKDISIKNSEKIKDFNGGSLRKVVENGKAKTIIVYDNGTVEDYSREKQGSLFLKDKVSTDLQNEINKAESNYLLVGIWFQEIDYREVEKKALAKANISSFDRVNNESIQKYIEIKRELIKEAYQAKNKNYYSKYIPNESVLFVSNYSPYIIAKLPAKNIQKLSKNSEITSFNLYYDLRKSDEVTNSIKNINANYTRDTIGLKGSGVKVGIIETNYCDKSNTQLNDRNITFDVSNPGTDISDHATKVTSIVVGKTEGLVPDANVYLAASKNRLQDYTKIEWLISQGVNVINYSAGCDGAPGTYTDMAKWIDHLANQLDVTFVKSAGNGGPSIGITDPGMAYNAITVGSIFENDSSNEPNWTDDSFSTFSAYLETEAGYKPDLTAPGQGIAAAGYSAGNGTSFSAPHVTAVIAQLFGLKAGLKTDTCALNAILKAGTLHRTASDYGGYSLIPEYSDREGAGVMDAKGAYTVANGNKYIQVNDLANSSFPYEKTISITSTTKPVRIALNWLKQNTLSDGTIVENDLSDLDLYVKKPDGTIMDYSTCSNNNTELVEFMPTVTGTYTIQVDGYSLENSNETFGLSWNQ